MEPWGIIFKRRAEEEQKTYSKGYFLHFKRQSATERPGGMRPERGPVDSSNIILNGEKLKAFPLRS